MDIDAFGNRLRNPPKERGYIAVDQLSTEMVMDSYSPFEMYRAIHITDIIQVHTGYSFGSSFSHEYTRVQLQNGLYSFWRNPLLLL